MVDTRAMPNGSEREGEHWNARLIREAEERKASGVWEMPDWMESYRPLVTSGPTGRVEDLVKRFNDDERLMSTNLPVYLLAVDALAQIRLLGALREAGMLTGGAR